MPKYKFEIFQYGYLTDTKYYDDYEKAQKAYFKLYNTDSCACIVYLDNKKLSFNETYRHFDMTRLRIRHFYL